MVLRAYLLLVLFSVLSATARAQPEVGTSDVPRWAEQLPLEEFSADRTGGFQLGVAYLLNDRQVRKTENGYEYVERTAYRIVDRSGLENSARIVQSFDPENETLAFNFVRILRDGEPIDRLTDAEITLLRQEEGLESSIIDGNVTALIELEDVRVGDVIDYSYSGSVASALWPDDVFESVPVEWSVPLAQFRFKLMVPEDMGVNVRGISTDIEPEVETSDGWKSFQLHIRDPDPLPFEQSVPAGWITYGQVVFTTMNSWSDIVEWAIPLFSFSDSLPRRFSEKLDEIGRSHTRPEDRVIQVLRLVQSEIRYLGLEVGLGSHVPRSPRVTLERGYGDCKDKSVLFVSALRYLGIEAVPALASVVSGRILPQLPPTIGGFDHVIVEVDIQGRKVWLDPTLSHQGGTIENLAPLGYGYVLPISDGQTELVELEEPLPEEPEFEIIETFEFPETEDVGLRIVVEHIYRNGLADSSRFQVASLGREAFGRSFLDYYAGNYQGVRESQPLSISDDLDANIMRLHAEYEMDRSTSRQSEYGNNLRVFGSAVQDTLPLQVEAQRTAPLALPYGTHTRHVVRVSTPGRRIPLPRNKSLSAGGVSYELNFGQAGDVLEIEYKLAVTERTADPKLVASITDIADEIVRDSELTINLNSAVPVLSERLGLTAPLDQETEDAIVAISAQILEGENVKALTGLNVLLSEHQEAAELRGALQLLKGALLTGLGRDRAALAAFDEGFALYEPTTAESYSLYMMVLARDQQEDRAARTALRMLERHPDSVGIMNSEWMSAFLRHLRRSEMEAESDDLIVATAQAAHEHQPANLDEFRWAFSRAVDVLSRAGDTDRASEYVPYLTDPRAIARLLASRDTQDMWEAIERSAGADLSKAIEAYVSLTREAAAEAPDDFRRLTEHVSALRVAGRSPEAVDFAAPFARNWPQIEAVGADAYWFINEYAYALSDIGNAQEAHAVMARLVDIGVAEDTQLISMAINRAAMLMHWEDFEAALAAVEEIERLGDGYASDYGWMWVYAVKACSLHQLGRTEEAEAVLQESILPIAETNPAAHTKTMLCLDESEQAADLIIDRLNDEENRRTAISTFIEASGQRVIPPFLAELQRRAARVRARPEVRNELNKVGRALSIKGPGTYWGAF